MKINKSSKNTSRRIVLLAVLIALLILGAGAYYYFTQTKPRESFSNKPNPTDSKDKSATDDENSKPEDSTSTDKGNQISDEPSETNTAATLTIDSAKQVNDQIQVRATVAGSESGGRCIAYFTSERNDAQSFYLDTQPGSANTTRCTKDISNLEFSYLGKWKVRVVHTSPSGKIVENSAEVEIR